MHKQVRFLGAVALTLAGAMPGGLMAAEDCDRECLKGFLDRYIEALNAHEPDQLPMTRNVKYTENGVRVNPGDGLWQTMSGEPTYRLDVIDVEAQQVGMLGIVFEGNNRNFFGTRLKVENGEEVSEIENLVARSIGGGGGMGGAERDEPHPRMFEPIPEEERHSRAELVSISDAYFTGLDTDNSAENVSFHPECQRRENGSIMASNPDAEEGTMQWWDCETQFETGFSVIVTDIRERRFEVVDPELGLAYAFGYFDHNGSVEEFSRTLDDEMVEVPDMMRQPFSFYIAEVFKVEDGQIRQIEAVLTTVPYGMESGW